MRISCLIIAFLSPFLLVAAKVDTLVVYSPSMKKETKTCVITPNKYSKEGKALPVLYLVHGYSGNYASWANAFPQVIKYADDYNMIIVGVDGGFSSWYFDSPIDPSMKYETYVTQEVRGFIEHHYNVIKNNTGRGICGLSMGGHGALYLAIRHQDIYGAAGSMSGGVDFKPFPTSWDLPKRLGEISTHYDNWEKNTVTYQVDNIKIGKLAIMMDCGTEDVFIHVNRQLHEKMVKMKIKHEYLEKPGDHNKDYWDKALPYQIQFFDIYFKKTGGK